MIKLKVSVNVNVEEGFQCISLFCKVGPSGLSEELHRQTQACLQDADGVLLTQPYKHGCFTEKWFSAGFCSFFVPLCLS